MTSPMHTAVPRLTVAPSAAPLQIEALVRGHTAEIESWFRSQWRKTAPPFYCSVDLRNAGFKLAPIDTNLFPAGFNNLNPQFDSLCVQAIQAAMERSCPTASNVLLVPENHTRNKFYLESVATLQSLIAKAGYKVRIGSLIPGLGEPQTLTLDSGRELVLEPVQRDGDRVFVKDFRPCAVVLNNDLSGGRPEILEDLDQPVIPPLGVGWSDRIKSQHFALYQEVAEEFAQVVEMDSWLVNPLFRNCGEINFMTREGEECLVANVQLLLDDITEKYKQYGVKEPPFVIVKAEAGTYGMGVMTVRSADDVRNLNRDTRKKMAATKEGKAVTGAIIQEGVYTFEHWGEAQATAEPVVYMIDHYVVGGFYRVHGGRSNQESLNAPGASFQMLAFEDAGDHPDFNCAADAAPNRFYAYGVVARLALLAAAREIAAVNVSVAMK
jgi:glutamate--cysteine ligase